MIKANELRIGNWVHGAKYVQVYDLGKWGKINEDQQSDFEPIPLTPEILKQCGFEPEGLVMDYAKGDFGLIKFDDGFKFADDDGYCRFPAIQYLHQLQNLYFALTQEELQCNFAL